MRTALSILLRRLCPGFMAAAVLIGGVPLISCDKPTTPPAPAAPNAAPTPAPVAPAAMPEPAKPEPTATQPAPSAPAPLSERDKIERMLAALAVSDAVFIRSGTEYSGKDAAAHLRMKWGAAGDRVSTAQQFIDLLASSSSATGDAYRIRTKDGKESPSRDWFLALLASVESNTTSAPPTAPAAAVKQRTPAEVLEILRTSKATFLIIEDDEIEKHAGSTMATRIGLKYSLAGRPDLSASQFIDQYCTRSSRHNTEYQVRVSDGSSIRLADWLRARLDKSVPSTPSAPTPPTSGPKP